MEDLIRIRPLHFANIIAAFGADKEFRPHPYGHAEHSVARRIIDSRDVLLEIRLDADDVCRPCRHNINGVCDNVNDRSDMPAAPVLMRDWDLLVNQRYCERLNLKQGDRLTAREFCEKMQEISEHLADAVYPEVISDRATRRGEEMKEGVKKFLEQ